MPWNAFVSFLSLSPLLFWFCCISVVHVFNDINVGWLLWKTYVPVNPNWYLPGLAFLYVNKFARHKAAYQKVRIVIQGGSYFTCGFEFWQLFHNHLADMSRQKLFALKIGHLELARQQTAANPLHSITFPDPQPRPLVLWLNWLRWKIHILHRLSTCEIMRTNGVQVILFNGPSCLWEWVHSQSVPRPSKAKGTKERVLRTNF